MNQIIKKIVAYIQTKKKIKVKPVTVKEQLMIFVNAIIEDKPTPVSGKDGLAPVLIALAAQESLNLGKPVKVDSV